MLKIWKRTRDFDKQDWKHVRWLFGNMIKQFIICEYGEAKEAFYFLKLHLTHDSTRVRESNKK